MELYLMQHGLACSAEENPERPLNPDGIAQAKAVAKGLKRLGLEFDLIAVSPKRRSHQTAALIAEELRYPYSDILTTETLLPDRLPHELLDLLEKETASEQVLVIGHLPHLEKLAGELLQGSRVLIENAGLTCFSLSKSKPARLNFHLQAGHLIR